MYTCSYNFGLFISGPVFMLEGQFPRNILWFGWKSDLHVNFLQRIVMCFVAAY